MAQIFLILVLVLSCCLCGSSNYHKRRLYYSEQDNCCIPKSDLIDLTIFFDDRKTVEKTINGNTFCHDYVHRYQHMISPGDYMTFFECFNIDKPDFYCDKLVFVQQATWYYYTDILTGIVQRSTIRNPAKFDQNDYDCIIDGDDTIQHFGPSGRLPLPKINVYCNRITSKISTEHS